MTIERRSFLQHLFAVPAGVALIKATDTDLYLPDRQIVTPVSPIPAHTPSQPFFPGASVFTADGVLLGYITDVSIEREAIDETMMFSTDRRMARGLGGRIEIRVEGVWPRSQR